MVGGCLVLLGVDSHGGRLFSFTGVDSHDRKLF